MIGIPTMPKYVKPAIVTLTSTANSGSTSGETDDLHPIDPVDSGFVGFDPISFHGLMDSWIEKDIDMNKDHARRVKPHIHLQYEMLNNDVHQSIFLVMLRLPTSLKPKRCPGVKDCGACAVERIWNGQNLTDLGANRVTDSKSAELEAFRKKDWGSSMSVALNLFLADNGLHLRVPCYCSIGACIWRWDPLKQVHFHSSPFSSHPCAVLCVRFWCRFLLFVKGNVQLQL